MDRAINFYTKTLGGRIEGRAERDMKDMWASVKVGKESFWLVKQSDTRTKKPDLAFSTFIVQNIKSEVALLRKRGAKFDPPEHNEWTTRVDGPISYDSIGATAFLKDTEGNLLMIFQAPKN